MNIYPNIDMKRTGERLEAALKTAGIEVKDLQKYLHLSCPQPIYRWFKGQILPSVDHLYGISQLLHMHMEDLIVPKKKEVLLLCECGFSERARARLLAYCQRLQELAA